MGGRYVIHVLSCFGEWVQKGWWILCKWWWVAGISNYLPTSLRFPNYFPAIHRTPTTSLKCSAWWKPLCSLNPNAITTSTIPLPALLPLLLLLLLPLPPPPLCLLLLLLLYYYYYHHYRDYNYNIIFAWVATIPHCILCLSIERVMLPLQVDYFIASAHLLIFNMLVSWIKGSPIRHWCQY
jgi:hypothetical protein